MWETPKKYDDETSNLLERADKLEHIGQFSAARDLYERILKNNPKDELIQFKMGDTYFAEKNAEMAEKWFKKSFDTNPKYLQPLTMLGFLSAVQENEKEAISYFEQALKLSKNDPEVIARFGRVYLYLGNEEKALEKFTLALDKDSKVTEGWTGLTFLLFFSEETHKVETLIEKYSQKNPKSPITATLKGMIHCVKGEHDEAINIFDGIKEKTPEFPIPWSLFAENSLKNRDIESAQIYLERDVKQNPDSELSWSQLAFVYKEKDMTSKVADALEQMIRINPDNMRARIGLASLGVREDGDFVIEQSMKMFDRAFSLGIKTETKDDSGGFKIWEAMENGEYDKVIEHCQKKLEEEPEDTGTLVNLANAYEGKEMYEESIQIFEKALEINETLSYLHLRIATCYIKLGQYDKALRIYDTKSKEDPENNLNLEYSQLYKAKGEIDKALEYLKKNYDSEKSTAELEYELFNVLLLKNSTTEALTHLENGLFKNLEYPYYPEEEIDDIIKLCSEELPERENKAKIQIVLGVLHSLKKTYLEAQNFFEDAIKSAPNDPIALKAYGYFFKNRRDFENAALYLEQALTALEEIKDTKLVENIAYCYKLNKEYNKALEILSKVEEEAINSSILHEIAEVYEKLEDLDKAEEYYRRSIEKDPGESSYYLKRSQEALAKILVKKNKWEEAEEVLEKLLENDPNNSSLLFELGQVYDELRKGYKAKDCFEKCLESDRTSMFRLQQIAQQHVEHQRYEEAKEAAQMLIEGGQGTLQTLSIMGYSLFSLEEYDEAEKHLLDLLEQDYTAVIAHMLLAEIYYMRSDYEEAAFYYRRFHELEPENENALSRLSDIYERLGDKEKAREIYLKSMGYD